jgi:hypothetical protein
VQNRVPWYPLLLVTLAVSIGLRAFREPWTWTFAQVLLALYVAGLLGAFAYLGLRHGKAELVRRVLRVNVVLGPKEPVSRTRMWLFWLLIAVAFGIAAHIRLSGR